jgi:hypothetical protein
LEELLDLMPPPPGKREEENKKHSKNISKETKKGVVISLRRHIATQKIACRH